MNITEIYKRAKHLLPYIGVAVLLILMVFAGFKACNGYDKLSILKGEHETLEKQLKQAETKLTESRKINKAVQADMDRMIENVKVKIADLEGDIEGKVSDIGKLEGELETIKAKLEITPKIQELIEDRKSVV